MIRNVKYLFSAVAVFIAALAYGQTNDTRVRIFNHDVKSLRIAPVNNPYLPAVYVLGSDEVLNVNFDVLNPELLYLRYSVTHCDALWRESSLVESEYVDGFNEADITDYAMSEATLVNYYNYNFTIPSEDMVLTKSGNYLLKVYRQDDPDEVLFQTRFSVSENTVNVFAQATSLTDVSYNDQFQQVSFEVQSLRKVIDDPYNELTCVVTQNSRSDNAAVVVHPLRVEGNNIIYEHNRDLVFKAGNEYRRFETVSSTHMNMGVESIKFFEPYYHATLYTDEPRAEYQYLYDQTKFGRFTIRTTDLDRSDTQSEYMITHFTLDTEGKRFTGGKLFLQGEFTEGISLADCLMKWDEETQLYFCNILLKQGQYNYQYLWVPDGTTVGDAGLIEGNKFQTVNEYLVRVYDRPFGERYDRLIGHAIIYFGK